MPEGTEANLLEKILERIEQNNEENLYFSLVLVYKGGCEYTIFIIILQPLFVIPVTRFIVSSEFIGRIIPYVMYVRLAVVFRVYI